jgi:hypothetical protein
MKIAKIDDFKNGWFIGGFEPSIANTKEFEVCFKSFSAGDTEPTSIQKIATEVTMVVSGSVRINNHVLQAGEICLISPGESADFLSITNSSLIGIKFPSLPTDKSLVK